MPPLAMFPLGTVLVPHMALPLHVFEPRYRALMHDMLAGDRRFGIVLITRGHEVGGGDQRAEIGTVARILHAEELDDGRWITVVLGVERIRVERWSPDDPYPRAEITTLHDRHDDAAVADAREALLPGLQRVLRLREQLGGPAAPPAAGLLDDPAVACWEAVATAPLTPLDLQELLAVDDCADRLRRLTPLLDGVEEALTFRLGGA